MSAAGVTRVFKGFVRGSPAHTELDGSLLIFVDDAFCHEVMRELFSEYFPFIGNFGIRWEMTVDSRHHSKARLCPGLSLSSTVVM